MEFASGNVFIRPNHLLKTGDAMGNHTHNFDHTSIVLRGAIRIEATLADGRHVLREAAAPAHFLIRAHVAHSIIATADDTMVWCVYSHRDAQGEVVQQYDGFADAYV